MLIIPRTKSTSARTFKLTISSIAESKNIEAKERYLQKLDFSVFQSGKNINKEAIEYVTKWLESKENSNSFYQLGVLNQQISKHTESLQHDHLAFRCFGRAADEGHAAAQCKLGEIYLNGLDASSNDPAIQKNLFLASEWLKYAMNQGNAKAKYLFAEQFLKPDVSDEDVKKTEKIKRSAEAYKRLLYEAAEAGYSLANLRLAEWNNECEDDQIAALQDVIDLYGNGNEYLSIEPDLVLHRIYLEHYCELTLQLTQTYLPNKPLLIGI